ncbi:hypothetical protein ACIPWE_40080 [Streptomyces sp. NPDC090073]|uniref:hypothetical protein n=1 Tax=Streptomyces sp. NPDC090073 TaxID=3365936 RepID=UPI003827B73D
MAYDIFGIGSRLGRPSLGKGIGSRLPANQQSWIAIPRFLQETEMHIRRLISAITVPLAVAIVAPGCASTRSQPSLKPPSEAVKLSGVCPSTVVAQADWEPEAENGALYHLLGPGYRIDQSKKRVSAPLVIDGMNTGVNIEVRAGGPAVDFQTVPSLMYSHPEITLGMVSTAQALTTYTLFPVTAVFAPLNKSPLMIMWDPASHPTWRGIADIGKSDAKVLVAPGALYTPLLVREGLLKQSQINASYDGTPTKFVTNPTIALGSYVTYEPYFYEHYLSTWKKPVKYQMLADVGYKDYESALYVRTGSLRPLSACLSKLVPILQRSLIEYIEHPAPTIQLITEVVQRYNDGWIYDRGIGEYAARAMRSLKIVANDSSGPLGGMDVARMQSIIAAYSSIYKEVGGKVKPNLTVADVATNQFIDKNITLR